MSITLTSGLFPVAQLPAAQLVRVRIYLTNLESEAATAQVIVNKLIGASKEPVLNQTVEVPGEERRVIELESDVVEGQVLEVVTKLPRAGFVESQTTIVPEIAVVSIFTVDESVSLLQAITGGEFTRVPG